MVYTDEKLSEMRPYIFLLITMLAFSQQTFAGKKLKVLFIGNSYTYVNDLPQITADVTAAMGDTLIFDSYTVGAYTLFQHSIDPLCLQKINSAKWDYVILQEQSFAPAEATHDFFIDSYYGARGLDQLIETNDSCTKVMFYMTWGYKDGFAPACTDNTWPYPCTYKGMDSLINLRYRAFADSAVLASIGISPATVSGLVTVRPSLLSPVGAVRHYIRDQYPNIELYQSDGSHPTPAGSYAAACTFYAVLFRKDPTLIPYNYVLNNTDAGNIKTAAKRIAFDSLSKWHIGSDLRAQFTFTANAGNVFSFTNTSTAATSFMWDFGDGNTSVTSNPTHTYATAGTHVVKLIAFNAPLCSDTTFASVSTSPTAIENVNDASKYFTVSPNPATDLLNITALKLPIARCQLSITNCIGQQIYFTKNVTANQQIDISGLNAGVYFITIKAGNSTVFKAKLLKL
jgi:hypothetical protein